MKLQAKFWIPNENEQARRELARLMNEHPDLPVIPIVCDEFYNGDDPGWIKNVEVGEYVFVEYAFTDLFVRTEKGISNIGSMCEHIDLWSVINKAYDCWDWIEDDTKPSEEEMRELVDALPWKKAILVYIEHVETQEIANY